MIIRCYNFSIGRSGTLFQVGLKKMNARLPLFDGADHGRKCHPNRSKRPNRRLLRLRAHHVALAARAYLRFTQAFQTLYYRRPLQSLFSILALQTVTKLLAQRQRQKRASHLAANRFVTLMPYRARLQKRLGLTENILHQQHF